MKRVAPRLLRRTPNSSLRCRPLLLQALTRRTASTPTTTLAQRTLATSPTDVASKLSSPTEAASVPFPGTGLRVSRVGFGSPWIGAAPDRALNMTGALSDGQCNLIQLASEVKGVKNHDKEGKPLPVPEWPERSWETRTFANMAIPRDSLALLWELSSNGKQVRKALSPCRAMVHLDRMLVYHELEYVDAFIFEIPWITGGESTVNDYRRLTGEAVRLAMTEFVQLAGDKVKTLGFSWQGNPHMPHPGRAPDSSLSDIIELRDLVAPSMPLVAMFPAGVGCGAKIAGLEAAEKRIFSLPEDSGVFQIGTNVTHARREDGRPFRLVEVNPRTIEEIMPDLKSMFGMAIHMELEYAKRFEGPADTEDSEDGGNPGEADEAGAEEVPPLPPKADVSWAHILAQNQEKLQGLDEWESIRDSQIKPSLNRALNTLQLRGEAEGEWGFLYRSTLGSLMSGLSEVMEVRKAHQLEQASVLMDELAPSLRLSASGRGERDSSVSGETVGEAETTLVGRCAAAALGTGVDCVLDEEFSASREAARVAGFSKVPHGEIKTLYASFHLPADGTRQKGDLSS